MHSDRQTEGIDAESVPGSMRKRQARECARTEHGKTLSSIGGDMTDTLWGAALVSVTLIVYFSYIL